MSNMKEEKPKLFFVVTEDNYFYSHRLPQAQAARNAGFDVAVITNVKEHGAKIEAENIRLIPLSLERRNLNPFKALLHINKLRKIYKEEKPALVHHIAMKPILYGAIAARLSRVPHMVNAFAGLGFVFSSQSFLARCIRMPLVLAFRLLLKHKSSHILLQNKDDYALLQKHKILPEDRTTIIRGSGVDLDQYAVKPLSRDNGDFICAFAARMIGIKGLPTLKEATEIMQEKAPHIHLWLCGTPDPENPGSWTEEELLEWQSNSNNVSYKGYQTDMKDVWAQSHCAVQPSYGGEGVPKALLEAAACGRAIVATDVPGCREVVLEGDNGYLVPAHDAQALAEALIKVAGNMNDCEAMGKASRKMIEEQGFSSASVIQQTEELYKIVAAKAHKSDS